jgi:NAD(P)H-flavin reductase
MLINLSNHPLDEWQPAQLAEAQRLYQTVVDLPFPAIDPGWDESEVTATAQRYFHQIQAIGADAVHVMGELTFTTALVHMLLQAGIPALASTTTRQVEIIDGRKASLFEFQRFRYYQYPPLFRHGTDTATT